MDININRDKRYITLTMNGYIQKLTSRVRPDGIKGASTPAIDVLPNRRFADANRSRQKLLQSVVDTLLYYSRQ
jgi:hypothetical protein